MRKFTLVLPALLGACGGTNSNVVAEEKPLVEKTSSVTFAQDHDPWEAAEQMGDFERPLWPGDRIDESMPASMGTLGDSITAGAVAKYSRTDAQNPAALGFVMGELLTAVLTGNFRFVESRGHSWATGMNPLRPVNSHAHHLADLRGRRLASLNAAVSGAVSSDVPGSQLTNLLEWSEKKLHQGAPDYTVILIGANDLCKDDLSMITPTGEFAANVATAVDALLERNPTGKVLVSALPKIDTLRGIAEHSTYLGVNPAKTCGDFWKLAKVCGAFNLEQDPAKIEAAHQKLRDYQYALRDLVEQRVKMYGDRVRLAKGPSEISFTDKDISVDCFHPGRHGQVKLADSSWEDTWWADSAK